MKKSKFLQSSKDLLNRGFKPQKCNTSLRLVVSRLKLLRNKKEATVKQMRREVAQLLESGQDSTARIRVEHVVREEKMMSAFELIALYSELIMTRMPIIESQKNCPIDLKEAITSLIFASPRCGDVPELVDVQKHFAAKYGKDFTAAAIELRPECGVSRMLVEKLSAKAPDGQTKLKILTAIAEEHNIKWDPKTFGEKDSPTPNDLLSGPSTFQAATETPRYEPANIRTPENQIRSQPMNPEQNAGFSQGTQGFNYTPSDHSGRMASSPSQHERRRSGVPSMRPPGNQSSLREGNSFSSGRQSWNMEFTDVASAAHAAAESAERASMAARAAAELASRDSIKKPHFAQLYESSPHVQRDGEHIHEDYTNSSDSERHLRSHSQKMQGVGYNNPGGAAGRSKMQDAYDSSKGYNRSSSSRSEASVDDASSPHGIRKASKYSQDRKPEVTTKKQYENSEYVSNPEKGFRSESNKYIRQEHTMKNSGTSHLHSSIYDDDNNSSNFSRQNSKSHSVTDQYINTEQGRRHRNTSWMDSGGPASAVSDESGSEDEKILFDSGPTYDEQDSDVDFPSPGRKSPFNVFNNHNAQDFGVNDIRSPKKKFSSRQSSADQAFSPLDDTKFDDLDGHSSDSEDSMDESGHRGRDDSVKLLRKGNQSYASSRSSFKEQKKSGSDQKPHFQSSSYEVEFLEVKKVNKRTDFSSTSSNDFDDPQFDLNKTSKDKDNDHYHKSSKGLMDDESQAQSSSELDSQLNFGKLTGGLKHKRYTLPSFTRSKFGDVSSSVQKPAEPAAQPPSNTSNVESKISLRGPSSLSDSDSDSSEDEVPVHNSGHKREPYTKLEGKKAETTPKVKGSVTYFESDSENDLTERTRKVKGSVTYFESESEDDLPKQISPEKKHPGSGFSQRTKPTPLSSETPKVKPTRENPKHSNSGADRKPGSSYCSDQSPERPQPQRNGSGKSRYSEESSLAKGSFKQPAVSKIPLRQESVKSAAVKQPSSPQQKVVATATTKSSQESPLKADALNRENSIKKASHVHPKLPDYDSLAAHLESLRTNR